jgi:Bifunctional DNA primase/polymerase, N-terminal
MTAHPSLAIALMLAALGVPVFPCRADKRPACSHGFKDASTDPKRIRELWALAGNAAVLVGVPTGEASGFDVLDIDPRNNGDAWENTNCARLGETRIHQTGGGGHHYLFSHAAGVRNSAGKIAPGVDVRGESGYAIWWPAIHDIALADIAPWPDGLLWHVLKANEPPPRPAVSSYTPPAEITDRRIERFIRAALDAVAAAVDGEKHYRLRNSALQIGGVAARAGLSDATASAMLIEALPRAKNWDVARRTVAWGLAQGRLRPVVLPDRAQFAWRRSA